MIATLSEFKLYLGIPTTDISKDSLLQLFLDGANSLIETYISRSVEANDYEEIVDGDGQLFLVLDHSPVNSIKSVSRNIGTLDNPVWEDIGNDNFSTKFKIGKVNFFRPLTRGFKNYKIEYNAGYEEIPGDLKIAVLKLASKYYNTKDSDGIVSEGVAGDSISYNASQIPNDIMAILSTYRDL